MKKYILSFVFMVLVVDVSQAQPMPKPATQPDLMEAVRASGAKIVVINFWATWCMPCVEEFPAFVRVNNEMKSESVKVIFVSVDFEDEIAEVQRFLSKHRVTDQTYIATGNQDAFIKAFHPEWVGSVPATFIYDGNGTQYTFWEGKVTYEELKQRIQQYLPPAENAH